MPPAPKSVPVRTNLVRAKSLPRKKVPKRGAPAWMTTFADMVTLLLAFFVLLFAFSEIEVAKLQRIAGSLANAFGVQREVPAQAIPSGDSVIAPHFEPSEGPRQPLEGVQPQTPDKDVEAIADELRTALKEEIDTGLIDIETVGDKIIIRIRQAGSFPMGSADIDPSFLPVLGKLRRQLGARTGRVSVAGHTDGFPIKTFRYRSNWDLSAARAVSVVHELRKMPKGVADERLEVRGLGATKPLEPNTNATGRARNRRVEIAFEPK